MNNLRLRVILTVISILAVACLLTVYSKVIAELAAPVAELAVKLLL